jgi:adenine-specific DNA glycosylase
MMQDVYLTRTIIADVSCRSLFRHKMNTQREQRLIEVARKLLEYGKSVGPFLPWHYSKDPYYWLVAEALLRRTSRRTAHKAYSELVMSYPTWGALVGASREDIAEKIAWVGLGNQRSKQLKALANIVVNHYGGQVPNSKEGLLELPGVSDYIAEAVLLHVFNQRAFPIDSNVQRVVRRALGFPITTRTRYSVPYQDAITVSAVAHIVVNFEPAELADIHRGLLLVAWDTCKTHPNVTECPLQSVCAYAAQLDAMKPSNQ